MISHALTIVRTANACARWTAVKLAKIETRLLDEQRRRHVSDAWLRAAREAEELREAGWFA